MPTTTYNQLDYPASTDAPDGPGQIFTLATEIDSRIGTGGGETCANYAAVTAIPSTRRFAGKTAYALDSGVVYRWSGTSWLIASARITLTAAGRAALPTAALFEGLYVTESDTGSGYLWTAAGGGAWQLWDRPLVATTGTDATGTGLAIASGSGYTLSAANSRVGGGVCYFGFQATYSGTAKTVTALGNLANHNVLSFSSWLTPASSGGQFHSLGANSTRWAAGYASSGGFLVATVTVPGTSWASGTVVDATGAFPLH